jgi:hypothetical protein
MNPLEHTGGILSWLRGGKKKIADDTENTRQVTPNATDNTPSVSDDTSIDKDEQISRLNIRIKHKDEEIIRLKSAITSSEDHYKEMEGRNNKSINQINRTLERQMQVNTMLLKEVCREGTEWKDDSEIVCIFFVTPSRKHVWLFKFDEIGDTKYPSNDSSDAKCSLEIRPTEGINTLTAMLQKFKMGNYLDFCHVLDYAGYNIDENIHMKGLQTVMLKRKKREEVLFGV